MIYPIGGRRHTNPIRLSMARELGRNIDGAWWPRTERINFELPRLVSVLMPMLGEITAINVNWARFQRPPDFNAPGWENRTQHIMTVNGREARANLLIVPYATLYPLALMVLRRAADLPIEPADRDKPAFTTACGILRAAQQQLATG